ncbi:MAG TPA: hypothetical protein VLA51_00995 [Paracoccaceae bacterium]|nr:hypothetical protein [Paracoccaceae bacterium]
MARRLDLSIERGMNITEAAQTRLRDLNETYGLGTNYSLPVFFEQLDEIADADKSGAAYRA